MSFSSVPANFRLVITAVSALALTLPGGHPLVILDANLGAPTEIQAIAVPLVFGGPLFGTYDEWVAHQQMQAYVDPGKQPIVGVQIDRGHVQDAVPQTITLTGYFVAIP